MSSASATAATTVQATEAAYVLQTYRRQPVVFVRGEGVWLVADDGTRYLDMLSGIGVNVLGHTHPALVAAVREQVGELVHTSNLFFHPYQGVVAERLAKASGLARAFFCNSGTEAVEGCLKFARRYWYTAGTPRPQFIAFERGFSGRTMGALSTTWDEHYRTPFEPLVPEVRFVSNEDPADLLAAVSDRTAAIIAEPIQGEGGDNHMRAEFLQAMQALCHEYDALFILDEVQTGAGTTGTAWAYQQLGLEPDIVAFSKKVQLGGIMAAETAGAEGVQAPSHDPHAMLDSVVGLITEHGGLDGFLEKFKANGLGETVASWVGTGDNHPVSGDQIHSALGPDVIAQIASKLGMDQEKAMSLLSQYLPLVINQLTPNGEVEEGSWLSKGLDMLKSQF